jgi:hypothetical protein
MCRGPVAGETASQWNLTTSCSRYGDFRRVHRMGLIACHYRAAEWRHKEIALAAHELPQLLDETTG